MLTIDYSPSIPSGSEHGCIGQPSQAFSGGGGLGVVMVQACHLSMTEVKAGGPGVQGHPRLHTEFQAARAIGNCRKNPKLGARAKARRVKGLPTEAEGLSLVSRTAVVKVRCDNSLRLSPDTSPTLGTMGPK